MSVLTLLFGFKGRINRAQFWLGNLGAGFAGITLMLLLGVLLFPAGDAPKTTAGALHMLSVIGFVVCPPVFVMCWVGLALQTKRFHDRGRSGVWTMLPLLPGFMITSTILAALAGGQSPEQAIASVGMWLLLSFATNIFMLVDLGCMPGKAGDNKYGPPPGGGFSGGAPTSGSFPSFPGQSAPAKTAAAPGMGLAGAQSAIDRAIATHEQQAKAAGRTAPSAQVSAVPQRAAATAGSFGRKAAR